MRKVRNKQINKITWTPENLGSLFFLLRVINAKGVEYNCLLPLYHFLFLLEKDLKLDFSPQTMTSFWRLCHFLNIWAWESDWYLCVSQHSFSKMEIIMLTPLVCLQDLNESEYMQWLAQCLMNKVPSKIKPMMKLPI